MSEMKIDPEVTAIATVCASLAGLESDEARKRVLEFAISKLGLKIGSGSQSKTNSNLGAQEIDDESSEHGDELLSKFDKLKPADNVFLLVAKNYSKFGIHPFTVGFIKDQADAAGLIVPARIDMTLNVAQKKGKLLFQKMGAGKYRPTVSGEAFLRETFQVKKGTAQPKSAE